MTTPTIPEHHTAVPPLQVRVTVTTLRCGSTGARARDGAGRAFAVWRRLRAASAPDGPRAVGLFESGGAGPNGTTIRRSIVVLDPLLRVELRGDRYELTALRPDAHCVLDALQPAVQVTHETDPAATDADRMRAPSPLDLLRAAAGVLQDDGQAPLSAGLFGALGYEFVDRFEPLPPRRPDPLDEPDVSMVLAGDFVVEDLAAGLLHVVTRALPSTPLTVADARHARLVEIVTTATQPGTPRTTAPRPDEDKADVNGADAGTTWTTDCPRAAFEAAVRSIKERIAEGDVFQTVLARGIQRRSTAPTEAVYAALRDTNPSPYMFHVDLGQGALLGASPETFVRVENGTVELRPIAGTAPRGADEDADQRHALALLLDPKEQAEHAMLLDLARNDVARVSVPGTTRVVEQFAVEKYSRVQHLVSKVRGTLRPGLDALHAYRAAANVGTLTGAPKPRAMQRIRELEPTARGFYGGAAGYLLADGTLDTCIVIRSLRHRDGVYYARAGAGVVQDSVPSREFDETEHKLRAVVDALAAAEGQR